MSYPKKQLHKCRSIADQIMILHHDILSSSILVPIDGSNIEVDHIVIEEINRHKSRMSGKTLDILHGILWDRMGELCDKITYIDSDGLTGWRTQLRLIMSDADRQQNKESKKLNKKLLKGSRKLPIITKKHLAARFVNKHYNLSFDVDVNNTDNDIVDSIGLGHVFVNFMQK